MNYQTNIIKIEEIPVTKLSYPFCSAKKYGLLDEKHYLEKEYYMQGTANVYHTQENGEIGIRYANAPYLNRFIVRAPEDINAFSGNVILEILNPTSFMDIDRMWILGNRQFMRTGDIYIGITSKPNTIAKLQEFDSKRYQKLNWNNPTQSQPFPFTTEDIMKQSNLMPDQNIDYETGLFWDMLTDLAILLRSDLADNPLLAYHPQNLILTGWSQSANYMIRYINDFAYRRDIDFDIFDGFLIAAPPRYMPVPLNQYECISCAKQEKVQLRQVKNPCIVLQTESENAALGTKNIVRNDGYEPQFMCLHYDIAGPSHDTLYSLVDYYQNDSDLARIGVLPKYNALDKEANNYPLEIPVAAMFRNLIYWIQSGVAPSLCERIQTDCNGENIKDVFGNTIGGIRTCLLDYPTGSFYSYSNIPKGANAIFPDSDKDCLFGHEEPYSQEMLIKMYGNLEHYTELITANTLKQVMKGYVVKEDATLLITAALNRAIARGLPKLEKD